MATSTTARPLVEQLMQTEGKAEIVDGKVVEIMSTGRKPIQASGRIYSALLSHADATHSGEAVTDNAGFLCDLPGRGSFSPDAAFYTGPDNPDDDMDFYPEPPVFAVEVRSKNDYGPKAERAIHAKIGDYFAAGTRVVWDVDLESDEVIAKYTAPDAVYPQIFRRGEVANAEPAVPGWTLSVDDLFPRARG
ncbi:MAG TPA: Uma2 family endonuclease [Abditibacterium sp.]|jgi:Uma2 family endonuclease